MIKLKKINISKRSIVMIALLLISLLSIFVVSKIVTQPDFNASTVQSLNDKESLVMKLAAAAAAAGPRRHVVQRLPRVAAALSPAGVRGRSKRRVRGGRSVAATRHHRDRAHLQWRHLCRHDGHAAGLAGFCCWIQPQRRHRAVVR